MNTKLVTIVIAVAALFYPRLKERIQVAEKLPLVMINKRSNLLTQSQHQAGKSIIVALWKARRQPFKPMYN